MADISDGLDTLRSVIGLREIASLIGGSSARPFETSNGTWFWKRLLIPMETVTASARMLGVSVRTLRNKITEYSAEGIDVPRHESRAG